MVKINQLLYTSNDKMKSLAFIIHFGENSSNKGFCLRKVNTQIISNFSKYFFGSVLISVIRIQIVCLIYSKIIKRKHM